VTLVVTLSVCRRGHLSAFHLRRHRFVAHQSVTPQPRFRRDGVTGCDVVVACVRALRRVLETKLCSRTGKACSKLDRYLSQTSLLRSGFTSSGTTFCFNNRAQIGYQIRVRRVERFLIRMRSRRFLRGFLGSF
jgi:hypothetical protein